MRAAELITLNQAALSLTEGTVMERVKALRDADMFAVGKQGPHGGAVMNERDVTNLLLACVLPHQRGSDVAKTVLKVRRTPIRSFVFSPTILPDGSLRSGADNTKQIAEFTYGLTFCASDTLGQSLESIARDMRRGLFEKWAGSEAHELTFELIDGGRFNQIFLARPHSGTAVVLGFSAESKPSAKGAVTRIVRIDGNYLHKIATAMGPQT